MCFKLGGIALVLALVANSVQSFVNAPKIISRDGNLIFESGSNRNISFRLSGTSRFLINEEYDVLELLLDTANGKKRPGGNGNKEDWDAPEDFRDIRVLANQMRAFQSRVFGSGGLNSIVQQLQNRTTTSRNLLSRYRERLRNVENKATLLKSQLQLDSCRSAPCQNGGSCYNTFNGYRCQCRSTFEGPNCESDVNECALYEGTDLGCQNGAQCVNQVGSFSCLCASGWHGIHCTQRKGDCLQSSAWELCGHGSCVPSNDELGYRCLCEAGWKSNGLSPACTEDVDECSESAAHTPCSTKCINLPGSFTCGPCPAGLTGNGVNCRDLDECAENNGGCSLSPKVDCINTYGSSHCGACPVGWMGDGRTCVRDPRQGPATGSITSCAQNINLCHPRAVCAEISNTVICSCPTGMIGSGFGPNGCISGTANNCNALPCLNGGTCLDAGVSNFTCLCPRGYRQPICEPLPNPCTTQPCRNGGRCTPTPSTSDGFVCQCMPGYRDRLCSTRFSSCNALLSAPSGSLRYPPNGPSYDHNVQCAWVIRTNESMVLNVTFNSFDMEDSTECRFDWLQINDGRSAGAQIIGRYCGHRLPHGGNIISSGNQLYLWFRSDNSTSREGFDLTWQSIEPQCGGRLEFDTHGTLTSPGSPGNYPRNRNCQWHLVASNSKRIKLTFFSLQLEQHANCNFDYVEILDAISGRQLHKFCSSAQPAPPPLLLATHEAFINFHSDAEGTDTGFQLHYSTEERIPGCGGVYSSKEGTIKSPMASVAGNEDETISCEYEIQMAVGESIAIAFTKFVMPADNCLELYDVAADSTKVLQAKYCGGAEQQLPPSFNSLYNRVVVKYYVVGPGLSNFELSYSMSCSYTYDSAAGIIASPGYPNLTNSERSCSYKIIMAPNMVIALTRIDFQMEDASLLDEDTAETCGDTNLKINDGLNKNILGPFCSRYPPAEEILSLSNMLVLILNTETSSSGRGFKFSYRSVPIGSGQCGGIHTKEGQNIRVPTDAGNNYANDLRCTWVIVAPPRKGVLLHWHYMKLEGTYDCSADYVDVYDGLNIDDNSKRLGRYCSSHAPTDMVTHARHVTIQFVSDYSDTFEGFELSYRFTDLQSCGGHIYGMEGMLTSPGYPLNYSSNLDCQWQLTSPQMTRMELQLEMLDLEVTKDCRRDYIEIRNGGKNTSTLVGTFCGNDFPRHVPSFTNELYIRFHSDASGNGRGFRLHWRVYASGCGGRVPGNRGVITSPSYPEPYMHNADCEWQLQVHPGSAIELLLEDVDMEDLLDCNYDYIKIYNEDRTQPLKTQCNAPNEQDRRIFIESNEAAIVFHSDVSNSGRGFRISFNANCQHNLTALSGTVESLNYLEPLLDSDPINCNWTIRAPRGNHIRLEFSHFQQLPESLPTERSGGVYLVDQGKIVHIVEPGATYNASGDMLSIVHNSSNVNFQLEYRIDGCLGEFRGSSGSFTSPNHPGMYPNNLECYWLIRVEMGQTIELTIEHLDLEESVNCTKDSLTISNHPTDTYAHERHCGVTSRLVVTSAGHKMHVRFASDASHNGQGFTATYRAVKASCGGKITARNGVIQSPNYPLNYPSGTQCEWLVTVTLHHQIIFDMQDMELESGSYCDWDYLAAFDMSPGDGLDDTEGQRIFKICDGMYNARNRSTSNTALLRFVSDDSVSRRGFRLHFHESCGQTIDVDETDFDYLTMQRHAPRNETCIWVLRATDPGKHIIFTPTQIVLHPEVAQMYQSEGDCMDHGIHIYDGIEAKGTPRSRFCRSHPPAIISNGRALTIKMPLALVAEFDGHYMTMDTACGSLYTAIAGRFTSPYYPSSYPTNIECTWLIQASPGNSLTLTLESMDLEQSDGCNNDYVEIREEDDRGQLIGVYCGNQMPNDIKSKGSIWIKFKSDDDHVGEGFMASYNYEYHNEINGTSGTIESPNYPSKFESSQTYSWRVTVDKEYVIVITINHIRDVDHSYLNFYDGYSDIGSRLEHLPGQPLRSSTNVVYFTSTRGPFELAWQRLSKESLRSNRTAEEQSRTCGRQLVNVNRTSISFNSPGYPSGYANNLQCAWTFVASNPGMHTVLQLNAIDLEQFGDSDDCPVDYLLVSSSGDMQNWRQLAKICTRPNDTNRIYHGQPYLRLEFITDASVNHTGFSSVVRTACGSDLTDSRGLINITQLVSVNTMMAQECVWTLRVRQGRRIRITFPDSQLQESNGNSNADASSDLQLCRNYFMVRNGFADDSPFLGRGKYCSNGITDILETTSNRAYIKFHRVGYPRFRASFRYEELSPACSGHIVLNLYKQSQVINSPNYPNLPHPHSECVWWISVPAHHRVTVEFIGKFDMASPESPDNCQREYIQLNDGRTELRPQLGRFCGARRPDTIYSSGSELRIKFYTDVAEPRQGFQARVSIALCGGSYYSSQGTINAPKLEEIFRAVEIFPIDECVYTIEMEKGNTIQLNFENMDFPESENCTVDTHLQLEEIEPFGDDGTQERESDRLHICGTASRQFTVETNKIIIRLRVPQTGPVPRKIGFRLNYKSVGSRCGHKIRAQQGILQTPGYPQGVNHPTHCVWFVEVAKGQRIKVEILDFDTGAGRNNTVLSTFLGRLIFANDYKMQSILGRYSQNPPAEIISADNTMGIDAYLLPFSRHRGFRLRFSAYGQSECGGHVNLEAGGMLSFDRPNASSLVHCNYYMHPLPNTTLVLQVKAYNSTSNPMMRNTYICVDASPLKLMRVQQSEVLLPRLLCDPDAALPLTVRLPFPMQVIVSGNTRNRMTRFAMDYKLIQCGGNWPLELGDNLTIQEPQIQSDSPVDCAWSIGPDRDNSDDSFPVDVQLEVSLSTQLVLDCQNEYVIVYSGPDQNSPLYGRYCGQATEPNIVVERGLFLEYHTPHSNPNSTFNVTVKYGSGCGGRIQYPYRQIDFNEQYKNNVECIWELESDLGFHIGLWFEGRFYIEDSKNCSKDYLLVQQRDDGDPTNSGNWTTLAKICGRSPPSSINTTSSAMRLIFRSDGEVSADGFVAKFERNCGGIIYADSEMKYLTSPGFPVSYETNLFCNWTIVPREAHDPGVLVSFVVFDLEQAPTSDCLFDNLTVVTRDESESSEAIICGVKQKHEYRAKKSISLILRTDSSFSGRGFRLIYSTRLCGGVVRQTSVIESPRQHTDNSFPPNSNCYWNLTAPSGDKFIIKFEMLDFESQSDCRYDGVEIYAGSVPDERQRRGRFCGRAITDLPVLSIANERALIHSYSDERDPSRGFRAVVRVIRNCDERIRVNASRSYTFSKYANPTGYDPNLDCHIVFEAPAGYQLRLEFSSFHVQQGTDCPTDYVELRDGAGPFADAIGKFCGNNLPPAVSSSQHTLFLRFVTDSTINDSGFELIASAQRSPCGESLIKLESTGVKQATISSPNDADIRSRQNLVCYWQITGDKPVHLIFDQFDMGQANANGTCADDFVKIYNREDATMINEGYGSELVFDGHAAGQTVMNFATEHVYCGKVKPDNYYANTNTFYVKSRFNGSAIESGFRLTAVLETDCSRHYTGLQGRVKFSETSNCDIFINAPINHTLSLYFTDIGLYGSNCEDDFIEVFDTSNRSLHRHCSSMDVKTNVFTRTNEVRVHLKSGSYLLNVDLTFLASPIEAEPGCGGQFYNTEGIFANPYYPQNVRNNSDCRWIVRVPSNNHVLITFEDFNLGSKSTCHTDFLQILETNEVTGSEMEMRRFCGEDRPRVYKSNRSQLVIRFHKSVNYDGIGWVIKFAGVYSNYEIPKYLLL